MINSILEIIGLANINQNDFIRFNPEKELEAEDFEYESNNFPFSGVGVR